MLVTLTVFQSVEQYKEGVVDIIPTLMKFWEALISVRYVHHVKEWSVRPCCRNFEDCLVFTLEFQSQTFAVAQREFEHLRVALSSVGVRDIELTTK